MLHVTLHASAGQTTSRFYPSNPHLTACRLACSQMELARRRQSVHQLTRSANRLPFTLSDPSPCRFMTPASCRSRLWKAQQELHPSVDDCPIQIATEIFRELLTHINYDQLYRPNQTTLWWIRMIFKIIRNSACLVSHAVSPQ